MNKKLMSALLVASLISSLFAQVVLARYIQSDPVGLNGGINTFTYALLSPTNYSDPYGLSVVFQNSDGSLDVVGSGYGGVDMEIYMPCI